jgi:hypothetical protein
MTEQSPAVVPATEAELIERRRKISVHVAELGFVLTSDNFVRTEGRRPPQFIEPTRRQLEAAAVLISAALNLPLPYVRMAILDMVDHGLNLIPRHNGEKEQIN